MTSEQRERHRRAIAVALVTLVLQQANFPGRVFGETIALRAAIYRCVHGTTMSGKAVTFVEQLVPPQGPLTDHAIQRIHELLEAIEDDQLQTFSW